MIEYNLNPSISLETNYPGGSVRNKYFSKVNNSGPSQAPHPALPRRLMIRFASKPHAIFPVLLNDAIDEMIEK